MSTSLHDPATIAKQLLAAIEAAEPRLRGISDSASIRHPAPGKWSSREIIGHLIDSAHINHGRFVRAQFREDLVFPGYAQDAWVRVQGYRDAPWPALIELFVAYNRHVARVIARVPPDVASRPRVEHNLHELAWQRVPADVPATLGYLMSDYVVHLEHHLAQVWRAAGLAGSSRAGGA
jgi:hypothetical protein